MALMLLAGLAGITKGLSEVKEKKDEETKQLIAARTKTAYQNYLKHQEQVAALKEEVKKRDAEALQYQSDLNDEERIALATMPNALELYRQAIKDGQRNPETGSVVTLRDVLKVGDKAKGMKYADFVSSLSAAPQPAAVTFQPQQGLFGTSAERQRRLMETMTGAVGMTPESLMAYERPVAAPEITPMGGIDVEKLFAKEKKLKSASERLQERESAALEAEEAFGTDDPRTIAAKELFEEERNRQNTLDPKQLKFADMVNDAQVKRVEALRKYGENSPQHKAAVKELEDIQGKEKEAGGLTPDQARKMIVNAGANAVQLKFGTNPSVAVSTDQFGNKSVEYRGDPSAAVSSEIRATQLAAIARQVRPYLDASGRPISASVRDALMEVQVPFDNNGRPVFDVVVPPKPAPEAPAGGAQRVTPPAAPAGAQPSPVAPQVAPAVRPGAAAVPAAPTAASAAVPKPRSDQDRIALEWAQATLNNARATPEDKRKAQIIIELNK